MNERIQELWEASRQWDSSDDGRGGLKIRESAEKFAELVAAHEREACAKLCEAEANDKTEGEWDGCCLSLANKIRARGEK